MIKVIKQIVLCLVLTVTSAHAQEMGQTIQINVRLNSFIGRPIWSLIIRDIDNGINIPYIFDFTQPNNSWVAFTVGRNYLITSSKLQIVSLRSRYNLYKNYRINNFCNIESMGRIVRGKSMIIELSGNLSPNSNTYTCHVSSFPTQPNFIAQPE